MCGSTRSITNAYASNLLSILATHEAKQDGIVQGFGVVSQDTIPEGYRVVPTSEPRRLVVKNGERAEAVATHLRIQNRELVGWWESYATIGSTASRNAFQAGAAATETMADILDAIVAGDFEAMRNVIKLFVNDAVNTGVVTV